MIRKNILTLLFLSLSVAAFCQVEIEEVSLSNLSDINTENDDFVAVPYGEGIMYNGIGDKNACDTCGYFNSLRFAKTKPDVDCGCSPSEKVSATNYPKKSNFNAPTFTGDSKTMYLTQNNKKPGGGETNVRGKKLKIVMAQMNDLNAWSNFSDVPFNMVDYETAHPALTADGQTMYFTSDRPGGVGGMDIWKVTKQGDTWSVPTNLGAPINSAGNEIFPSISSDGTLYYSSNKSGGSGNLDVYSASMQGGSWTTANLGAPFNSSADDLGYVENPDGESGYITSNRAGGKGNDDLYCWKVNKAPVKLIVEDGNTNAKLPGSSINVVCNKGGASDYVADGDGSAEPDMTYRRTYTVNVEKEGYLPWSKEMTAKELAMASPYVVPLVPKAFNLAGDVKFIESLKIAPGSKVVLHNITTGEKREAIADANGNFTFDNIHCFEDYELIAYNGTGTQAVESAKYDLPASAIDCSGDETVKVPLKLPEPPPIIIEKVCPTFVEGMLALPTDGSTPKSIGALGSRPEFGNSHDLDGAGFYNKLQARYNRSARDKKFLDELFTSLGYPNGFADANESTFYSTTIPNGMTGNMGYTKRHRMKYVQLNARNARDLEAFKVASINGCDVYFMKTCGNLFYFKQ